VLVGVLMNASRGGLHAIGRGLILHRSPVNSPFSQRPVGERMRGKNPWPLICDLMSLNLRVVRDYLSFHGTLNEAGTEENALNSTASLPCPRRAEQCR
jgi:hypothetical protein